MQSELSSLDDQPDLVQSRSMIFFFNSIVLYVQYHNLAWSSLAEYSPTFYKS